MFSVVLNAVQFHLCSSCLVLAFRSPFGAHQVSKAFSSLKTKAKQSWAVSSLLWAYNAAILSLECALTSPGHFRKCWDSALAPSVMILLAPERLWASVFLEAAITNIALGLSKWPS